MIENIDIALKFIVDKRFRNDVKAFNVSKPYFEYYGWELLENTGISKMLENGVSFTEIVSSKRVKNKKMLANVLDSLVGAKVLSHSDGIYRLVKKPKAPSKEGYKYLEENYPNSIRWGELLRAAAEKALLRDLTSEDIDFDKAALLWNGIMLETPYSFRLYAIQKMLKGLENGAKIMDLGCGSGIAIEDILMESVKEYNIDGVDLSKEMLKKADERIKGLIKESDDSLLTRNLKKVKLRKVNIMKDKLEGKYDAVFCSLVINHIPPEARVALYKSVKKLLKPNGKFVVYQIIHESKFKRNPIWVMHMVPSHTEYPYRAEHLNNFKEVFSDVKEYMKGHVIVAKG